MILVGFVGLTRLGGLGGAVGLTGRRSGTVKRCILAAVAFFFVFIVQSHAESPERGMFLLASRSLRDPNFKQTVVLLLGYDGDGALGLIINRPTSHNLSEVFPGITGLESRPVFFGGPVAMNRLFFLFSSDMDPEKIQEEAREVLRGVYLSSDELLLKRIIAEGENEFRLFAGYSGWGPGQLDGEMDRGDWYLLPAELTFLFREEPAEIWSELIRRVEIQVACREKTR